MDPELSGLLAGVARAHEGDADAAEEVFADDAVFQDRPGEPVLEGPAEIVGHFLAFGGRRERFLLHRAVREGAHAAVEFALVFRADAHAYAQRGMAMLTLEEGRIAEWRGVWTETSEEDLASWGYD